MSAPSIMLPRTTLNIITSPQTEGLQTQRALLVGQVSPGIRASGKIVFAANPIAAATITLGGTAWTFVASGATAGQTNIAGTLALTLAALATALNASSDTNIVKAFYVASATTLFVFYKTGGTAGNAFTLAASLATPSGSTLLGGLASTGSSPGAGALVTDIGQTGAALNNLFGANSHLAQVGKAFRKVNAFTNLDAIALSDAANGLPATAQIVLAGTATRGGTLNFIIESAFYHTASVNVNVGDSAQTVLSNLNAAVAAFLGAPWTYSDDAATTAVFMAVNAGLHANDWVLAYTGNVPGITVTLTGWAGGSANPSLTSWSTPIANLRYQTIVWPAAYSSATIGAFLDARKNVTNRIMEGRAFTYKNLSLTAAQADTLAANSSEVVEFNNVPTATATYIGPHIPEAPDALAAKFAAARARRFETDQSISDIVSTNAVLDQFGGIALASLPYFNTPILNVGLPVPGTGYDEISQEHAETTGVAVMGVNDSGTAVITGVVVTTWQFDNAGNPDTTWRYLEARDTHGVVREYIVNNVRKRFEQSRLTSGDLNWGRDMANEALISAYIVGLCQDLQAQALIVDGLDATTFIKANLVVTINSLARSCTVNLVYWQVSQLEVIQGTVQFTFSGA